MFPDSDTAHMIICHEKHTFDIAKDPATGKWLLDTSGAQWYHLDRCTEHISVKDCFAVNLFHISSFDLRIVENSEGQKAFLVVKKASMGDGDLYQSGGSGFSYKNLILYCSESQPASEKGPSFLLAEDLSGKWSAILLLHQPGLASFISCFKVIPDRKSEEDVKARLLFESDVNLDDEEIFIRVDETFADETVRHEKECLNQI